MLEGSGADVGVIVIIPETGGVEYVFAERNVKQTAVPAVVVIRDHKRTVLLALDFRQGHNVSFPGIGGGIHAGRRVRQRNAAVPEFGGTCIPLVDKLLCLEMQDNAVLRAVIHGAHRGGDLKGLAVRCRQREGTVQRVPADDRPVRQIDQYCRQLAVSRHALGQDKQGFVLAVRHEVSRQDSVGSLHDGAERNLHAQGAERIKHPDVAVPAVVLYKGSRCNQRFVADLRSRHLHTAADGRVKRKELCRDRLLLIQDAHNRMVRRVCAVSHEVTLARHDARSRRHAVNGADLGKVDAGLHAQIQIRRGVVDSVVFPVGDAVRQVDEGIDDVLLRGVGHVQVHCLQRVEVMVGVQRFAAVKEHDQFVVVHQHLLAEIGGNQLRRRHAGQSTAGHAVGIVHKVRQNPDLTVGQRDQIGGILVQSGAAVPLGGVQTEHQRVVARQYVMNAGRRDILSVVWRIRFGEYDSRGVRIGFRLGVGSGGVRLSGAGFVGYSLDGFRQRSLSVAAFRAAGNGTQDGEKQDCQCQQDAMHKVFRIVFHVVVSFPVKV